MPTQTNEPPIEPRDDVDEGDAVERSEPGSTEPVAARPAAQLADQPIEPEDGPGSDRSTALSRSRVREQARAFTALAEQLVRDKRSSLPDPPFGAELLQALVDAQRMVKSARSRQIRRLAQLLRGAGPITELRDALEGRTPADRVERAWERGNEDWRGRLLAEGDPGLAEFIDAHPHADRTRLRQLMRQASRTPPRCPSQARGDGLAPPDPRDS